MKTKVNPVEFFCTTCCREKQTTPGLMPACERYTDPRIHDIHARSIEADGPEGRGC